LSIKSNIIFGEGELENNVLDAKLADKYNACLSAGKRA